MGLPKTLYSCIIGFIIQFLLNTLSNSKKAFLNLIHNETSKVEITKKAKKVLRTMQLKLTFYFIINFIFLFFFWYYVSAFCGVYKQTQVSWLTGGLISFAISLGVPFVICVVFASMRLIAFKYKNKTLYTLLGLLNSLI